MKWIRAVWSILFAFIAGLAFSKSASAATLFVDDDKVQCPSAAFTTIRAAVNAASSGDSIKVCPGIYPEQVTVPAGKNNLSIGSTVPLAAIIQAPAVTAFPRAIVHVDGAYNALICSFTIQGPFDSCDTETSGVLVDGGGSATIRQNHITAITGIDNASCAGVGVQVGNPENGETGTASVLNNTIDDYDRIGVYVALQGSSAIIKSNIIGPGNGSTVGIQVEFLATADAEYNTIAGNFFGVWLFGAGAGTCIANNTVDLSYVGIYVVATNYAKVIRNAVPGNLYGIYLDASNYNQVAANTVSNSGNLGIAVTDTSAYNTVKMNTIMGSGGYDAFDNTTGGGTAGTANFWLNDSCGSDSPDGLCSP